MLCTLILFFGSMWRSYLPVCCSSLFIKAVDSEGCLFFGREGKGKGRGMMGVGGEDDGNGSGDNSEVREKFGKVCK